MVSASRVLLLTAACAVSTSGFRVRPKRRQASAAAEAKQAEASHVSAEAEARPHQALATSAIMLGPASEAVAAVGEPGQVDFLYNFGAPGSASPGLQNQRGSSSCFPGLRIYQSEPGTLWGKWLDIVARVANAASYWHPWMPSMEMDVSSRTRHWKFGCSLEQTYRPNEALSTSISLHGAELYIEQLSGQKRDLSNGSWYTNMSIFAARKSYIEDPNLVHRHIKAYGWGLVGSAAHPGGNVYGGAQITHLVQHPVTLECAITFQGTTYVQDWLSNFRVSAHSFCGLTYQGESCGSFGTCSTRRPRGSFVHGGFKERLMTIVKTPAFQSNIRPKLSSCARVYAVGHSLGGAMAELFTACNSRAPKQGEFGYEDYQWMGWTKGTAAHLQVIGEEE